MISAGVPMATSSGSAVKYPNRVINSPLSSARAKDVCTAWVTLA